MLFANHNTQQFMPTSFQLAFTAIVGENGEKEKATFNTDADAAHIFAASLGSRSSTAALIGMANIGAIVSSFIHVVFTSKPRSFIRRRLDLSDFRLPLILSR